METTSLDAGDGANEDEQTSSSALHGAWIAGPPPPDATNVTKDGETVEDSDVLEAGAPADDGEPAVLDGTWTVARGAELLELARTWAAARRDLVLDCSRLERLDAATLQVLLALHRELGTCGHKLTLVDVPAPIAKAIRLGGLEGELLACP